MYNIGLKFAVCGLQIVSVGFIAVGIFKIGMLARKGQNNTGIKVCQMFIHCASMLCLMVVYLATYWCYFKLLQNASSALVF